MLASPKLRLSRSYRDPESLGDSKGREPSFSGAQRRRTGAQRRGGGSKAQQALYLAIPRARAERMHTRA
jgi:hypothetical protein